MAVSGERKFFRRDRLTGLVAIGAVGVLCAAWQTSRERAWRASHGLLAPRRN